MKRYFPPAVAGPLPNGVRATPRCSRTDSGPSDRQTLLKVDRLYSPQYWEHASLDATCESSWHYWWDTVQPLAGPHEVWTRTATQGIPSPKDRRTYVDSGDDS